MKDKVVLVTGGSSGIGKATAEKFVEAGASVIIAARDQAKGNRIAQEIGATFIQADMGNLSEIEALISKIVGQFGRLDIGVNNAGISKGGGKAIFDFDETEFDEVIDVNLKGVWGCMKYQIAQMVAQEPAGGAIVNVSSVNGLGGARNGSLYSASKSGVIALTKSAAQEFATQGVRINVLAAGGFDTPMLETAIKKAVGEDAEAIAKAKEGFASVVPMRRIGDPQEAADAIFWLCSEQSSYVTGHTMIVDGGMTAYAR